MPGLISDFLRELNDTVFSSFIVVKKLQKNRFHFSPFLDIKQSSIIIQSVLFIRYDITDRHYVNWVLDLQFIV